MALCNPGKAETLIGGITKLTANADDAHDGSCAEAMCGVKLCNAQVLKSPFWLNDVPTCRQHNCIRSIDDITRSLRYPGHTTLFDRLFDDSNEAL